MQKKVPQVPLMVEADYEADGWLGLLLGTCSVPKFGHCDSELTGI
jgi:hypothetical protein